MKPAVFSKKNKIPAAGKHMRRKAASPRPCLSRARALFSLLPAVFAPAFPPAGGAAAESRRSAPLFRAEDISPALVKITIGDRPAGYSLAGFAIGKNTAVTNASAFAAIFHSKWPILIKTASGRSMLGRIERISFLSNLAVLETSKDMDGFLELGAFSPESIEDLYVPLDFGRWLRKAEGTKAAPIDKGAFYYFFSDLALKEDNPEGAPVLNEKGHAAGVVSRASGNFFHFISAEALSGLLNRPGPLPEKGRLKGANAQIQEEIAALKKLARKGNHEAKYRLGVILSDKKWLEAAAKKGHVKAQLYLGLRLLLESENKKAFQWIKKAAKQGYPEAQSSLAGMLHRGEGAPQNNEEAFLYYQKAAAQGHVTAQTLLGVMLLNGEGAEKNLREAVKWLKAGAAKGDPMAEHFLLHLNLNEGAHPAPPVSQGQIREFSFGAPPPSPACAPHIFFRKPKTVH